MGSIKYYVFTRFFGLIVLKVLVIFSLIWAYLGDDFVQDVVDENFKDLTSISKSIEHFYLHQAIELERITKKKAFSDFDKDKAKHLIDAYINIRGLISSVHYYNINGDLEFASLSDKIYKYRPTPRVDDHPHKIFRDAFYQIKVYGGRYFSPPLYTKAGTFYHVGMIPVVVNNQRHGVLSFAFFPNINPFNQSLQGLVSDSLNFLSITDEKGNIIAKKNIETKELKPELVKYIKNRGVTPAEPHRYVLKDLDDLKQKIGSETYYMVSKQVKNLPFFVVLGVNEKILINTRKKYRDLSFVIVAIAALIGILASWFISMRISKGVYTLVDGVNDLRKGTFKKSDVSGLPEDFKDALASMEDLSIEIEKGKLLGNFWGQGDMIKNERSE